MIYSIGLVLIVVGIVVMLLANFWGGLALLALGVLFASGAIRA